MIGALCETYHWPHDFWRRMGWRELRAWLRERNRSVERRAGRARTSTSSWSGQEHDSWWAEQKERQRQIHGR